MSVNRRVTVPRGSSAIGQLSRYDRKAATPLYTAPAVVDPRIEKLAGLLVERCIDVQPGWQVIVHGHPAARPLLEEVCRRIGRRGAYALLRVRIDSPPLRAWMLDVDEAALAKLTEIETHEYDAMDTYIVVEAPENTRDGSEVPAEKLALRNKATRPHMMPIFRGEKPWVGLDFPTQALAQDAGMTLAQFEDFYWGAMLVDWEALAADMRGSQIASTPPTRYGSSATGPISASASPAGTGLSTPSARTCRAARSSTRPSRTRPRASSPTPSIRLAT